MTCLRDFIPQTPFFASRLYKQLCQTGDYTPEYAL